MVNTREKRTPMNNDKALSWGNSRNTTNDIPGRERKKTVSNPDLRVAATAQSTRDPVITN